MTGNVGGVAASRLTDDLDVIRQALQDDQLISRSMAELITEQSGWSSLPSLVRADGRALAIRRLIGAEPLVGHASSVLWHRRQSSAANGGVPKLSRSQRVDTHCVNYPANERRPI
jgi:hypothetical protein